MQATSFPDTETKALRLYQIMSRPLPRNQAEILLSNLCSDGNLSMAMRAYEADHDVRPLIKARLEGWLENVDLFLWPWEPSAIEICRGIVEG